MISLPNPTKTLYTEHSSNNDMPTTETLAEFAARKDAENTIQLSIVKHCLMLCDALTHDAPDSYGFYLDSMGRRYHKIFMTIDGKRSSIHAFIDKKTGDVYKPASIKAPAKHVRFNLLIIEQREWLLRHADWAGGYLYKR